MAGRLLLESSRSILKGLTQRGRGYDKVVDKVYTKCHGGRETRSRLSSFFFYLVTGRSCRRRAMYL